MLHRNPLHRLVPRLLVLLGIGFSPTAIAVEVVAAKYESEPFLESDNDADADDPAIWVHPTDRSRSLVIGTLKNGGLVVMNLKGQTLQRIAAPAAPGPDDEPGRFNNVDLLLSFAHERKRADLAVVTDRGRDKLVIYKIDPRWSASTPPLTDVTAPDAPWVFSASQADVNEQRTAYGLATHNFGFGHAIGFVSQRERARIAKVRFVSAGGKVTYQVTDQYAFPATFRLPNGQMWTPCADEDGVEPQFEGMVIDKEAGKLYAAQETVGVWRMNLDGSNRNLVERVRSFGVDYVRTFDPEEEEYVCEFTTDPGYAGEHLTADAEGLTIYYAPRGARYLIASSQGDNTFPVWNIEGNRWEHQGTFAVRFRSDVNQESDGAHVVSVNLGGDYPLGLLVTQDGENTPEVLDDEGEEIGNTNFKFTSFDHVIKALDLDL